MEAIRALKDLGADVSAHNNNGWTAVILAGQNGHVEAIRALKDLGADVNAHTNAGSTAMQLASHSSSTSSRLAKRLLSVNSRIRMPADAESRTRTALGPVGGGRPV